jgi:hypothetical protein
MGRRSQWKDVHGNQITVTDPNGSVIRTVFDGLNRRSSAGATRRRRAGTTLERFR